MEDVLFYKFLAPLVPDALRTKYEPDVEKEEASFEKSAAKLPAEKAQVNNITSIEMLVECCILRGNRGLSCQKWK